MDTVDIARRAQCTNQRKAHAQSSSDHDDESIFRKKMMMMLMLKKVPLLSSSLNKRTRPVLMIIELKYGLVDCGWSIMGVRHAFAGLMERRSN